MYYRLFVWCFKMEVNRFSDFQRLYNNTPNFWMVLIQLMQKINKHFSFTWLWGNIHSCNMTYQYWYTTFLLDHFSEGENLLVFCPCTEPRKEVWCVKNWLLLKVWTPSKVSGLILQTNIKVLYIMTCLKQGYVTNIDLRYPYIVKP